MLKYKSLFFMIVMALCFNQVLLHADDDKFRIGKSNFSKSFQKKWENRSITVRQELSNKAISGYFPNSRTVEKSAEKLYHIYD